MSQPRLSVGVPLYRSKRFLGNLRSNLDALAAEENNAVIVSDRHCFDDTIDVLREEYGHDKRFRFNKAKDELNWVEHMNLLLQEARGEYFRWMPHDDWFPPGCLGPLIERLDADRRTVLAYAPTRAIDEHGVRVPERDRLESNPLSPNEDWGLNHSLELFWRGTCDGAFKGLLRRNQVIDANLLIRPTRDLVFSERAWLFGVSLLGGLAEEPDSEYFKRFYPNSTHALWRPGRRHILSATSTMCGYLLDHGADRHSKLYGTAYQWGKAVRCLRAGRRTA